MISLGNLRRLGRLIDVRADRDDGYAIAALQDRFLHTDFRMPDLVERNLAAVPAHQREIARRVGSSRSAPELRATTATLRMSSRTWVTGCR